MRYLKKRKYKHFCYKLKVRTQKIIRLFINFPRVTIRFCLLYLPFLGLIFYFIKEFTKENKNRFNSTHFTITILSIRWFIFIDKISNKRILLFSSLLFLLIYIYINKILLLIQLLIFISILFILVYHCITLTLNFSRKFIKDFKDTITKVKKIYDEKSKRNQTLSKDETYSTHGFLFEKEINIVVNKFLRVIKKLLSLTESTQILNILWLAKYIINLLLIIIVMSFISQILYFIDNSNYTTVSIVTLLDFILFSFSNLTSLEFPTIIANSYFSILLIVVLNIILFFLIVLLLPFYFGGTYLLNMNDISKSISDLDLIISSNNSRDELNKFEAELTDNNSIKKFIDILNTFLDEHEL